MEAPSDLFLICWLYGALSDLFLCILFNVPFRSISSHTKWGSSFGQLLRLLHGRAHSDHFLYIIYSDPSDSFFAYYMGTPSGQFLRSHLGGLLRSVSSHNVRGFPSDQFLRILYVPPPPINLFICILLGGPLRSVSLQTIWGSPLVSFFTSYMMSPQISFFAYYIWGPPHVSFFAYYMHGGLPCRSVSLLTICMGAYHAGQFLCLLYGAPLTIFYIFFTRYIIFRRSTYFLNPRGGGWSSAPSCLFFCGRLWYYHMTAKCTKVKIRLIFILILGVGGGGNVRIYACTLLSTSKVIFPNSPPSNIIQKVHDSQNVY